jgi:hypothetical protein
MPNSYDIDNSALRADALLSQLLFEGASLRAHEKENSLAPALVSQEAETAGRAEGTVSCRDGAAHCRGSGT